MHVPEPPRAAGRGPCGPGTHPAGVSFGPRPRGWDHPAPQPRAPSPPAAPRPTHAPRSPGPDLNLASPPTDAAPRPLRWHFCAREKKMNQNRTKQGRTRAHSTCARHGTSPTHCADARRRAAPLCPHCADARRRAGPSTPHCAVARRSFHVRSGRPAEPTSEKSRGRPAFPRPDCSLRVVPVGTRHPENPVDSRILTKSRPRPEGHGLTVPVPATLAGFNPLLAAAHSCHARLESRGFLL